MSEIIASLIQRAVIACLAFSLYSPVSGAGVIYIRDEAKANRYVTCSGDLMIFTSFLRAVVEENNAHFYGEEAAEFFEEENIVFLERSVNYLQTRAARYSDDDYVNELVDSLNQKTPLPSKQNINQQIVTNSIECIHIINTEIRKESGESRARKKRIAPGQAWAAPRPWFGR